MMDRKIGNVGVLDLSNATEESIKGIERIENVGTVIYRRENAHLISQLNIGNIGKSLDIPEGYSFINGTLNLDQAYLDSIREPVKIMVNGVVIIDKEVQPDQIKKELIKLVVNGKVYSPAHLSGSTSLFVSEGSTVVETYDGAPPRFEKGEFTLTNSFLRALDEPLYLVVNGLLTFSKDLNMEIFNEKISRLEINGKITLYEDQEPFLYKKTFSLAGCKIEVIPNGFELVNKTLRLNGRSIRRFQSKKIYTKKPVIFEKDVSRELLSDALEKIHSTSIIVCHENVEDLIYERISILDTEVLTYEHSFVMIEGDEVWSNDQFTALDHPTNFIVKGQLTLDLDIEEDVLREKVLALDLLGEVIVPDRKIKGWLQNVIRINTGRIVEEGKKERVLGLGNVGKLSL
jgi:hypothetical protein